MNTQRNISQQQQDASTATLDSSSTSNSDNDSLSLRRKGNESQWIKILRSFSFKANAYQILNLDSTESSSSLGVIHGLRVITMAWIIMGHTIGLVNPTIHSNVFAAEKMYTDFLVQGLLNATLSVDTFFFISGLLTVYVSWKKLKDRKSIPVAQLMILRYFRLTPPYLAVLAFSFVFPFISSGPLWRETVEPITESCFHSWWTNLLYVNNFVKTDKLCLMHSWYLSNDMQMHLFAIAFLILLLKSKLLAFLFLSASMVSCTAYAAVQTFVNDYPPTIVSTSPAVEDRWHYILDFYYKPWPHLPSYCIGLIVGYTLANRSRLGLTRAQNRTTWFFVGLIAFIVLYGVYPWNLGWKISPEVTALYSSTFRTLWTACCAWLTIALLTENKNCVAAQVLSWKGLLPFSRLTYMAFLIHPFVIWFYSGSLRERFTANNFNYFHLFLGHYLLTYMISFVFGVCFESPFMSVIKILLEPKKPKAINEVHYRTEASKARKTSKTTHPIYQMTAVTEPTVNYTPVITSRLAPATVGVSPSILYFNTNTV